MFHRYFYKTHIFPLSWCINEEKLSKMEEETSDEMEMAAKKDEKREAKKSTEIVTFIYQQHFLKSAISSKFLSTNMCVRFINLIRIRHLVCEPVDRTRIVNLRHNKFTNNTR